MKYSNGPFKLVVDQTSPVHSFRIVTCEKEGYIEKEVARINPYNIDTREGDGHLLAAAPELLAVVMRLDELFDELTAELPYGRKGRGATDWGKVNDILCAGKRAWAKARGEEK